MRKPGGEGQARQPCEGQLQNGQPTPRPARPPGGLRGPRPRGNGGILDDDRAPADGLRGIDSLEPEQLAPARRKVGGRGGRRSRRRLELRRPLGRLASEEDVDPGTLTPQMGEYGPESRIAQGEPPREARGPEAAA